MVSYCLPMVSLLFSYGFPIVFSWFSDYFLIVSSGVPMVSFCFPCIRYSFFAPLLYACGFVIVFLWFQVVFISFPIVFIVFSLRSFNCYRVPFVSSMFLLRFVIVFQWLSFGFRFCCFYGFSELSFVFLWFPRVVSWFPIVFPLFPHDVPSCVLLSSFCVFLIVSLLCPMDFLWSPMVSHGFRIRLLFCLNVFLIVVLLFPCGFPWFSYGVLSSPLGFPMVVFLFCYCVPVILLWFSGGFRFRLFSYCFLVVLLLSFDGFLVVFR